MTLRNLSAAAALAFAVVSPALAQTRPSDTGSMNYPAPLPQGNVGTTATGVARTPTDTGNMQYPAPVAQGNIGNSTPPSPGNGTGTNTGSMQYPAPQPQGTIGSTTTK